MGRSVLLLDYVLERYNSDDLLLVLERNVHHKFLPKEWSDKIFMEVLSRRIPELSILGIETEKDAANCNIKVKKRKGR